MHPDRRPHLLSVAATLIFLVLAAGSDDTSSGSSSSSNAAAPPDDPAILSDAKALDEKHGIDATVHCGSEADDYLRSIAKYDFKWDDMGFLDAKFDKYLAKTKAPGVLTLVSRKAKLQNGFGAYQHIQLYCDYDTQKEKVRGFEFLQ